MNLLKRLLQGEAATAQHNTTKNTPAQDTATADGTEQTTATAQGTVAKVDGVEGGALDAPQALHKTPLSPTARKQKKQQLFRAINACKELLREPMLRAQEMQLLYRNGEAYQLLQSETRLLAALPALLPDISAHQQNQMENFELSLELLDEKKAELDALLPPFLTRENALKADIQAFTKAVNEAQSKHKLSPDWDGKKPTLMRLGAQLQERREAYNKDEERLNTKTEKLYALHAEFYQEFSLFCEELLPLLEAEFKAAT